MEEVTESCLGLTSATTQHVVVGSRARQRGWMAEGLTLSTCEVLSGVDKYCWFYGQMPCAEVY